MLITLSAEFNTRRDAEIVVEHAVQEHGIDRKAVTIVAASADNSAGTQVAGSDLGKAEDKPGQTSEPALAGRLRVSVEVDEGSAGKVKSSFASYGGTSVA